ncbi:MAG TPA: phytoene desaturase family protein [Blastocatellia bacterium]|jgi:phytoene desaturase|nr:phytoene desaturase family protein [Blastocatellia bacterium]
MKPLLEFHMKHAVIIGGGLGGLALALRLAARNWRVTVCEQGDSFGGKMNYWAERGFRFDTGPSLITMPWVFEDLFQAAGGSLQEHLTLEPVQPLCDYVYDDGARFTYSTSLPEWLQTVRQLEADDERGFLKFLELGSRLYEVSKETFLRRRPLDWPSVKASAILRHLPIRYGWGNYHRAVTAHFKSPHLRQLYDRYPTYVGSSPYRSPATLAVIPYLEYAFGGWHVKGGLYRIVKSLVELAGRVGVELLTRAPVERIEHEQDRVRGVRLIDHTRIAGDVVVMNGDASEAPVLLGAERAARLPLSERSLSGLIFLLGVRRNLPQVRHHTVYFSADYRREFAELFDERRFPDDPTVYVSAPSRSDRSLAPAEGETLFVMANAPANDGEDEWNEEKIAEARRRVFARLCRGGFPDIETDVVVSDVWTPRRIARRYAMPGGAIYGSHSHGWRHAFLRPPNKDAHYQGLYYVGGSTHPGGGTPTVLLSAKITSELIERYEHS